MISKWEKELPFIKERGLEGWNRSTLAKHYNLTKQRMHQIISRYIPDWDDHYGFAVGRKESERKYLEKWGKREDTDLYEAQRGKFFRKKTNAKNAGYNWDIVFGDVDWPKICPVLGIELDYFSESRVEGSPSFDRLDNTKSYIKGNVQVISWRANRIKNDGTAKEHRQIADFLDSIGIESK